MTKSLQVLDDDFWTTGASLFPQFDGDPWVAYHGTCGASAARIESEGFRTDTVPSDILAAASVVAAAFDRMHWCGEDLGGFAVLKPWSLRFDMIGQERKIVFAESSRRAILYATRDFAGGELIRALRRSIQDLRKYVYEEDCRVRHRETLELEPINCQEEWTFDADWIESVLTHCQSVEEQCRVTVDNHERGVVFAVRFRQEDLPALTWNTAMGLTSTVPISADRIIGRVDLHPDTEWSFEADTRRIWCGEINSGVWRR